MVAHCNICQVELRSLLGGSTLTPVPLAGTKFCGGEHTVQGSTCAGTSHILLPSHVYTQQPFSKNNSSCTSKQTNRRGSVDPLFQGGGTQTFTCTQGQAASWEPMICSRIGFTPYFSRISRRDSSPSGASITSMPPTCCCLSAARKQAARSNEQAA